MAKVPSNEGTEGTEGKEKAVKVERVSFIDAAPTSFKNDDGRLTAVPAIGDAEDGSQVNGKLHTSPKKIDFATEDLFMDFKANESDLRANQLVERSAKLRAQAEEFRTIGDPAKRAKVRRLTRLREQAAELEKTLAEEGITV